MMMFSAGSNALWSNPTQGTWTLKNPHNFVTTSASVYMKPYNFPEYAPDFKAERGKKRKEPSTDFSAVRLPAFITPHDHNA